MEKFLNEDDFIISKTDKKGIITYGNEKFIHMSGYKEHELLGAPHNILRHEDMPKVVFDTLWREIAQKREIFAFVKNRCKNGDHYWVFANLTASIDKRGEVIGYYSVRRKPNPAAIREVEPLYKTLRDAEKAGGIEASRNIMNRLLQEKGVQYNEFIVNLQK
ncbi:MAG: PAS domain-containing protein [Thiovulaceae bacterium]|nr:PAS domain-containing protein [Sulfurimonadaceae bacterium]